MHTVINLFSHVLKLVPDAYLILAGQIYNLPFLEFGLSLTDFDRTLNKAFEQLGIAKERVHLFGHVNPDMMRNLYNISDLTVNFTLHHDENFGYAQVESMACGTPVVGTQWGGLKDTITDGVTGYQISTTLTPIGVKIDWWEILNKIVYLLRDEELRNRFSHSCIEHAIKKYDLMEFSENIEAIISELMTMKEMKRESIKPTPFGAEYWIRTAYNLQAKPPYRRGPRSYQLYQELIAPYTGTPDGSYSQLQELNPEDILILAAPTSQKNEKSITISDPLYPAEVKIPDTHREEVCEILRIMSKEPAIKVNRLTSLLLRANPAPSGGLAWLVDTGILLRSRSGQRCISPTAIGSEINTPLFSIRHVQSPCDLVVLD